MIEVDLAKKQLRVLHARDDEYIALLLRAALKHVENVIDQALENVLIDGALPADLVVAALMLVTDMYEHRAAHSDVNLYVNRTVDNLIAPYRVMGV